MEPTPNSHLIPVHTSGETLTVSSVDFANGLGIHHKNLLNSIRTHQRAIEANFGRVAFETQPLATGGGVQNHVVAYLTEDQALFIGTLSRNSKRVVEFKATLVKSFAEARRRLREASQAMLPADYIRQQEQRLADLEQQLKQVLDAQQQAARLLLDVPRSTEPLPVETTRIKIQRIVNGYCRVNNLKQQDIWRRVYDRLFYLYRVNIRAHKRSDRESWLDVAERSGHLEKIYAIVSAELTYREE
ncbi:Rha family transcriptional regulator [Spirosoma sp. SC4-14]|uniref:Rha family transcriptional regulator n=1 Tax=Spirosoma sp. SC4-14 TaxID=3128900 RepID=UPI0030CAD8CE